MPPKSSLNPENTNWSCLSLPSRRTVLPFLILVRLSRCPSRVEHVLTRTKGSGKTLIACLLIRHMISEELEARSRGAHRRVSFFLVDSVTLVFQQASVLSCNVDAKVGKYYGDLCSGAKDWSQDRWAKILDEDQVIVMTGNPDKQLRIAAADLES